MADVKVSGLPSDSSLDGNHYVPLNDPTGPTTKRTLLSTLAAWLFTQANIPAGDGSPITRTSENNYGFAYSGVNRNGSMTSGVIYINGKRLSIAAVSARTYTASKDTYIFVDDTGAITYSEQTAGTIASLPANSLCIGLVITNGTTITKIVSLIPRSSQELARAQVVLASATNLICPYIPAKSNLNFSLNGLGSGGTLDTQVTFNGDTGTNYAQKYLANLTGTPTDVTNTTNIAIESGATVSGGTTRSTFEMMNSSIGDKIGQFHNASESDAATDASVPRSLLSVFLYDTATQVTRMDWINGGSGSFGVGSFISVRGAD